MAHLCATWLVWGLLPETTNQDLGPPQNTKIMRMTFYYTAFPALYSITGSFKKYFDHFKPVNDEQGQVANSQEGNLIMHMSCNEDSRWLKLELAKIMNMH